MNTVRPTNEAGTIISFRSIPHEDILAFAENAAMTRINAIKCSGTSFIRLRSEIVACVYIGYVLPPTNRLIQF